VSTSTSLILSTITAGGKTYTIAISAAPSVNSTSSWAIIKPTVSSTASGPAQYTGAASVVRSFTAIGAALGGVAAFAALL